MANYDQNIIYCPVCGMIAILPQNALGKTRFPKHMNGGICPYCDSALMETTESYEEIAVPEDANWIRQMKPWEEIFEHVYKN